MTDTPPHIALARVKEIANGANKITEAELQSLCDLAIKALTPPPPGQYDGLIAALYALMNQDDRKSVKAVMGEAAAAITNLQQQVRDARVPAGYAVVPVEPTLEMLKDGAIAFYGSKKDVLAARLPDAYRAMIEATKKPALE